MPKWTIFSWWSPLAFMVWGETEQTETSMLLRHRTRSGDLILEMQEGGKRIRPGPDKKLQEHKFNPKRVEPNLPQDGSWWFLIFSIHLSLPPLHVILEYIYTTTQINFEALSFSFSSERTFSSSRFRSLASIAIHLVFKAILFIIRCLVLHLRLILFHLGCFNGLVCVRLCFPLQLVFRFFISFLLLIFIVTLHKRLIFIDFRSFRLITALER